MRLRASAAETSGRPAAKARAVAATSSSSSKTSPRRGKFDGFGPVPAAALDLQLVLRIRRAVHRARPPRPDRAFATGHFDHVVVL